MMGKIGYLKRKAAVLYRAKTSWPSVDRKLVHTKGKGNEQSYEKKFISKENLKHKSKTNLKS